MAIFFSLKTRLKVRKTRLKEINKEKYSFFLIFNFL